MGGENGSPVQWMVERLVARAVAIGLSGGVVASPLSADCFLQYRARPLLWFQVVGGFDVGGWCPAKRFALFFLGEGGEGRPAAQGNGRPNKRGGMRTRDGERLGRHSLSSQGGLVTVVSRRPGS